MTSFGFALLTDDEDTNICYLQLMKRVLLSIAIFCLALPMLGQFHYYPLKEVKDTIQYLKLNFDNQSSYFKGKTFDEFWQILRRDISPKKCNKIETSPFVDPHGESYVSGAFVACMDTSGAPADTCEVLAAHININFKPPYVVDAHDLFYMLPDNITVDGRAKLLANFIIDKMWVATIDRRQINDF